MSNTFSFGRPQQTVNLEVTHTQAWKLLEILNCISEDDCDLGSYDMYEKFYAFLSENTEEQSFSLQGRTEWEDSASELFDLKFV